MSKRNRGGSAAAGSLASDALPAIFYVARVPAPPNEFRRAEFGMGLPDTYLDLAGCLYRFGGPADFYPPHTPKIPFRRCS
jgi:hypothetical protein